MGKPLQVLIVEDSEDDMLVLLHTLEQNDYDLTYTRVVTAPDMSAALKQSSWDIILCDYTIPGFDAPKALSLLKNTGLDIPFIIISGTINEETVVPVLKAGAHDFILKERMARLVPAIEREMREAKIRQKQRETEVELEKVLQKLNFHVENSPLGVIEWNSEFQVMRWSSSAEKIFGWFAKEAIGRRLQDWQFVHEDDVDAVNATIARMVSYPQTFSLNRNYTKNGSIIYCEWYNSALIEDGKLVSVLSLALDVSDRVRLENERNRSLELEIAARAEAEKANRLKDQFLATLSHELRTPLNPILGWIKLLQSSKLNETKTVEALATIERNAKLQAKLVEDLLDISRIIQGKLTLNATPVSIALIIGAAIETVRLAAEAKSIQLITRLSPNVGQVLGDATRLQQVIGNLLSNAVKFTSDGGQIEIRLEQVDKLAKIQVIDTGIGINPEFQPYVFEHFRQFDSSITRKFGGLGLGLAIARQIVELHGGTIRVESQGEGQGTTFTVCLLLHC
ncbi:two-component hybrid sensor and regulator [Calothrix sp. NIES-4071]|nr:two-component hybrid sensor and regulator [Calothrix sp. NIES-4071]BAZ54760.1 two-component hybrid sensor and regulator [Calothrix sp. NIES-4105]